MPTTLKYKNKVHIQNLGLIDYKDAWNLQEEIFKSVVAIKLQNRDLPDSEKKEVQHHLLLCEHPHVYTLGKSGSMQHLLANERTLQEQNATFYKINRGGDITYHGPGQLVGYPILDLDEFFTDIHKYLRYLEEIVIKLLAEYGIEGGRLEGATGVWLDPDVKAKARKICAMGVRCSRWVTMHGFALNVNADLNYFNHIIPCGIADKQVTSIEKELDKKVEMNEIIEKFKKYFAEQFEVNLVEKKVVKSVIPK